MKGLIGFVLLLASTYVLAQETTTLSFGPYEWNYFQSRVQNTLNDVQLRVQRIKKETETQPERKVLEIEASLHAVAEIERMIQEEFKILSNLNNSQKEFIERSKNLALKLKQELIDLRQKIKPHINGVYYDESSTEYPWGPYKWAELQLKIQRLISTIEKRVRLIGQQIKINPERNGLESLEIDLELTAVEELESMIKNIADSTNLNPIQEAFVRASKAIGLKLKQTLIDLKSKVKQL